MAQRIGCITQPTLDACQARIGGRSLGWFPARRYGGLAGARAAAQARIDTVAAHLPPPRAPRLTPQANNASSPVGGVSRGIKHDRRRGVDALVYQVYWHDGTRPRNKTFWVGRVDRATAEDEAQAARAAEGFRRAYVNAVHEGTRFDPSPWDDWRRAP